MHFQEMPHFAEVSEVPARLNSDLSKHERDDNGSFHTSRSNTLEKSVSGSSVQVSSE